jgi:hypothetical protein
MSIHEKIVAIMRETESIPKDRKNTGQGYNFRGIDDVYLALHNLLAKHGVFTVPEVIEEHSEERVTKSGSPLIYRILKIKFHFMADDGSEVCATMIGEGMDSGDKAANKAMSVAHKYALLQVFAIPTDDAKDPENDNHDLAPKKPEPTAKDKCTEIGNRLKLSDDEKASMAKAAGGNYSNLLIMLQAKEKEVESKLDHIDDALNAVFDRPIK